MRTTRRQLLKGALAAGALTGLAACTTPVAEPTPELPALTIGLTYIPNVQFSPFYVAVNSGLFSEQGLDVTLRHHGAQEDAFGALLAAQEDIVFASGDEAVVASATGATLATFGTGFQQFPGVLLAAKSSGITGVEDLRGRTIGMPGHFGSSYYTVLAALHHAGLGEGDVKLQDIGYTQVSALTTGRVDVVVGYSNNETVQFANTGFDVVEIAVQDPAEPTLVGPGLVTVPGRLNDEVLTRVNAAVLEAEKRILMDPDLAIEATKQEVPTLSDPEQEKTARAVLEATSKLWLRDGEPTLAVDPAAFERMGKFLAQAGIISAPPAGSTIAL
ncbi:ABC transporter substrate-binding protein [Tessaracoccus antarcticus]|uniref:Twin-arginine translocation signal domain-containing protein n=1 Tax=Tessaracoccus antarcticus TaxID=2479848 RepID=A0A3M0G5W2_9ACTN|nr:ABC transporter substrate-binding protein [Tessaracoccus antarcticus]RMB60244.1 twin-arginine translocation signal domain-containing protein [Tessaracoccus antarcticus]